MDAAAQAAAADVEELVVGPQAAADEEVELQAADRLPQPADEVAMVTYRDLRRRQLAVVGVGQSVQIDVLGKAKGPLAGAAKGPSFG